MAKAYEILVTHINPINASKVGAVSRAFCRDFLRKKSKKRFYGRENGCTMIL